MSELAQELDKLGGDVTTALERLPLAAFLLDRDGVIRWQNGYSRQTPGDNVGKTFTSLIAPDEVSQARDLFVKVLCEGNPAEFTLRVTDSDGLLVPLEISSVPLEQGGSVVGVFGISRVAPNAPTEGTAASAEDSSANTATVEVTLTPRQIEVLQLLSEGATTHEIAAKLHLSVTTVRNHIANILPALGVHTRLQAVVVASQRRLLNRRQ